MDEAHAEKTRKELLELKALSAAVESTGQAKAEATSRAESMKIEAEAAVEVRTLLSLIFLRNNYYTKWSQKNS